MKEKNENPLVTLILLPFRLVWRLTATVFSLAGRLVAMLIGLVLMIVGVLLSLTGCGGIIGLPLGVFGFALILRGLF
jgi:hypothetical protein